MTQEIGSGEPKRLTREASHEEKYPACSLSVSSNFFSLLFPFSCRTWGDQGGVSFLLRFSLVSGTLAQLIKNDNRGKQMSIL
jgi:hypothetical protein